MRQMKHLMNVIYNEVKAFRQTKESCSILTVTRTEYYNSKSSNGGSTLNCAWQQDKSGENPFELDDGENVKPT